MATLHVRNVPEEIYDALRHRAAVNGRSIGMEATMILGGELGPHALLLEGESMRKRAGRRGGDSVPRFEPAAYGFRVVELKGDAADWERELNAHAARGHELLEIVNGRAIFTVRMSGP